MGIFEAIAVARGPISAEAIHERVDADLVTVYRTLEHFFAAGLIREVRFKDDTVRYEVAEASHHHHVVCTRCGIIDELENCNVRALEKSALGCSRRFASIDEHQLEFFGTCVSCAKR